MELGEDYSITSDYGLTDYTDAYESDTYTTTGVDDVPEIFDDLDFGGAEAAGVIAFIFAFIGIFIGLFIIVYVYNSICAMKIFGKANHKNPWAGWVPYYNLWVLAEVGGYPGYLGLIAALAPMVPAVGALASLVLRVLLLHKISLSFGKDAGYTVGLVLLYPIFIGILAFGSAEYIGPGGDSKVKPEWANK